jgi:hypothetical protein
MLSDFLLRVAVGAIAVMGLFVMLSFQMPNVPRAIARASNRERARK